MYRSGGGIPVILGVILLGLSLSFSGCGQSSQSSSAETKEFSSGAGGQSAKAVSREALTALLPPDGAAGSWRLTGQARTYGPDDLWEYIDGGAEGYLVYNFEAVVTADYELAEGDLQAVVDIYRMADQLCGFGIFAAERAMDAARIEIGSQGYLSDNALNFWQGPYYVKVTSFSTGEPVKLELLARAVASRLDAQPGLPPALAVFPAEGLVEGSQRYMARDVLGQSQLKNGFTADYKHGETEFKLFFILHDNVEAANESYGVYREFMLQYGQALQDHPGEDFPLFSAKDPYYGMVVAMQSGKAVLGIMGLDDPELVNEYLKQLADKLSLQDLT